MVNTVYPFISLVQEFEWCEIPSTNLDEIWMNLV